ncbi:MAG: PEP-CTERM sorting domain-containing protein, partial [Bryobacteraceae bacterium]
ARGWRPERNRRFMYKIVKLGLLSLLATMAASASVTYDFTGTNGSFSGSNSLGTCATTNGGYCADGDTFTQTTGGVTLTATAWNSTSAGAIFATAELFKSGSAPTYVGLGVCNSNEGTHTTGFASCTNTEGYVDNSGSLDLILFTFSSPLDPTQITLNTVIHEGTDTQWWYSNLTSLTGQSLNTLGAPSGTSSSTTINLSGVQTVSSIIFSVSSAPGQTNDGVKVTSLSVNSSAVPEPATFGMAGMALVGLGLIRRKR